MAADHNDTFFQSYRSLLATLWSCVVLLTMVSFSVAGFFTFKSNPYAETDDYYNNYNDEPQEENRNDPEVVVTSRAIIFCSLWTAVLAFLVAIYGTVILGIQTPTLYYTCCSPHVHKTTGLSLGSLIGALLMFANLTLVCAVMFGEFNIRDFREGGGRGGEENDAENNDSTASSKSPMAFSILCLFLTILYAAFAGFLFVHSETLLHELRFTETHTNNASGPQLHSTYAAANSNNGYIGERFDVPVRRPTSNFDLPPPKAIV